MLFRSMRVFSVAEVLDTEDKMHLENFFHCPIAQIYQATEGFLAISHRKTHRLLFNEDNLIIEKEWIAPNRFIPIITDLNRKILPIVRYRLDDVIVSDTKPTPFTEIQHIEGREGDICYATQTKPNGKRTNVPIFADVLRHALISTKVNYSDYQIKQLDLANFELSFTPTLIHSEQTQIEKALNRVFKNNNYQPVSWHWKNWHTVQKHQKKRKIIGYENSNRLR